MVPKKLNQIFRVVEILNEDNEVFMVIINNSWWDTYEDPGYNNGYDEDGDGEPDYDTGGEFVRELEIREIRNVSLRSYALKVTGPEFNKDHFLEYEIAKFILLGQESELLITMEKLEPQKLSL
jgi:hypothetical protein